MACNCITIHYVYLLIYQLHFDIFFYLMTFVVDNFNSNFVLVTFSRRRTTLWMYYSIIIIIIIINITHSIQSILDINLDINLNIKKLTVAVYGATVPDSSALFPKYPSKMRTKFKDFHTQLCCLNICSGISTESYHESSSETILHVTLFAAQKNASSPINYNQV